MKLTCDALIERQGSAYYEAVLGHIEPGQPSCILNFPDHDNSGDSAIYLGEVKMLDDIGSSLNYVCSQFNYDPDELRQFYPEGPIFIHGGGNFGDIYFENIRRQNILKSTVGRRVIQLPQSIFFQKQEAADQMARVIEQHGNFHLMVRDIESFKFAKKNFKCEVSLVPDAAYYLGRLSTFGRLRFETLSVQRSDSERSGNEMSNTMKALGPVIDWQGPTAPIAYKFAVLRRKFQSRVLNYRGKEARNMGFREQSYRNKAQRRLNIAVGVLSKARVTVSDRLHAHIIASLLRKPHVTLDNFYGKIGNYIQTWGNDGLALRAGTVEELKLAVRQHLDEVDVPRIEGEDWQRQ